MELHCALGAREGSDCMIVHWEGSSCSAVHLRHIHALGTPTTQPTSQQREDKGREVIARECVHVWRVPDCVCDVVT